MADVRVDIVHLHGLELEQHLPPPGVPIVATLHLSPSDYAPEVFRLRLRGPAVLCCVSATQRARCPEDAAIAIGVPLDCLLPGRRKRGLVVALGRIGPEKGLHLAIEAAERARVPLVIGGGLFPYEAHARYFERDIAPRLGRGARFLGPLGLTHDADDADDAIREPGAGGHPTAHAANGATYTKHHGTPGIASRAIAVAIDEVRGLGALEALRDEWRDLYARCPWATPFQHPAWLLAQNAARHGGQAARDRDRDARAGSSASCRSRSRATAGARS